MSDYHVSVLLDESVQALDVRAGRQYIDATLGGGGHAIEIARRGGTVLGMDVDDDAVGNFKRQSVELEPVIRDRISVVRGNFTNIREIAEEKGFGKVSGILFDLGVSGHQFDTSERGFSFQRDGDLDMRMDRSLSVKASDLINGLTKNEMMILFERYGEEHFAKRIAEAIVESRTKQKIVTTTELAYIIEKSVGRKGKIHPATRVFQALRIAVNDELHSLDRALQQSSLLLGSGGKMAVISFHSLEDRIVKRAFLDFVDQGLGIIETKKPVTPGEQEVLRNPRARSAKLRIFTRK